MVEDTLLNYLILYAFLELYEVWWQKANTILGMLARMYGEYQKSVFVFLLMHPTFYFAIMFVMISDYNPYALMLVSLKGGDILTKMFLLKKVFIDRNISEEFTQELLTPLAKWMPFLGLFIYLPLIYFTLV
jgi:uncharacterized membrane protein